MNLTDSDRINLDSVTSHSNEMDHLDQDPAIGFGHPPNSKYNLRDSTRSFDRPTCNVAAHLDQDESGDYDPKLERTQSKARKSNLKKRARSKDENENPRSKSSRLNHEAGDDPTPPSDVTPDAGNTSLGSGNAEDGTQINGPNKSQQDKNGISSSIQGLQISGVESPQLTGEFRKHQDIPFWHPDARGCKGCFEEGIRCSLFDSSLSYPCENCIRRDIECELNRKPKKGCESCRKRGIQCSWSDGDDTKLPCKACKEQQIACVDENGKEVQGSNNTKSGKSSKENSEQRGKKGRFTRTQERPFRDCANCRRLRRWCSLAREGKVPPCNYCYDRNLRCTFEAIMKRPKLKQAAEKQTTEHGSSVEAGPDPTPAGPPIARDQSSDNNNIPTGPEITNPNPHALPTNSPVDSGTARDMPSDLGSSFTFPPIGMMLKIRTRFANPIQLHYIPQVNAQDLCNWCVNARFGVMGHGKIDKVQVIRWSKRDGFTEIQGGYRAMGYEPDKLCHLCTETRLAIACCEHHDLHFNPDLGPENDDTSQAIALLMEDPYGKALDYAWCGMCASFASFECYKGCGLRLCKTCAALLDLQCHGSLTNLLSLIENDYLHGRHYYPVGARADASFLLKEGEVWQRIMV